MKAVIRMYRFGGGASLSLMEYQKAVKDLGYETEVCGQLKGTELEDQNIIKSKKIYNIEGTHSLYSQKKLISMIKSVYMLYKILEVNSPCLYFTTCIEDTYFISKNKALKDVVLPIVVIAGGKANYPQQMRRIIPSNNYICFSQENIETLKQQNYKIDKMWHISNRLKVQSCNDFENHYFSDTGEVINLVVTSRLDKEKQKSILLVIEIAKYLHLKGINVNLKVLGDGNIYEHIAERAHKTNIELGKNIVELCGYQSDVMSYFSKSHICFGKGRSVIEPLMMNRIGVIIGDDTFKICDSSSFENLYHYNFAGRNIEQPSTYSDIYDIIEGINSKTLNSDKMYDCFELVRSQYDSSCLNGKLANVIDDLDIKYTNRTTKVTKGLSILSSIRNTISYTLRFILYKFIGEKNEY